MLDLIDHGKALEFIDSIAARLKGATLREKVFRAMVWVMAESGLNNLEKNVMIAFASAFQIPLERLTVIKADIAEDPVS